MTSRGNGSMEPYDPYRQPGSYGGQSRIRSRPVSMKTVAAVSAAQWIGRRVATRLTPFFLIMLLVLGLPLAFWASAKVILAIGLGLGMITYATNRHVSNNDKVARQWAFRTTLLSSTGTLWILLWHWMHERGDDVVNENMLIAYWLYGVAAWCFLYTANTVGLRVAWERMQRDFAPVARKINLAGATLVTKVETLVGDKLIVDIRGTGRTQSELTKSGQLGELMAAHDGIGASAVRTKAVPGHAGFIEISRWVSNPWAQGIPHPLAAEGFPVDAPATVVGAFPVGKDPETGNELFFEIVNDEGGMHWALIAGTRGGKTNLINNVVEYLTRCRDAQGRPLVDITLIDVYKGLKDAANWAPAVHKVCAGPKGKHAAVAALAEAAEKIIPERVEMNGRLGRSKHVPTWDHPVKVYIIDEASFLLTKKEPTGVQAINHVNSILKAGASELVLVIVATQRAVLDHLGTSDIKANAFGMAILPVRRASEMTNIIPDWRDRGMPNMAEYGDGAKGTVTLMVNDEWAAGRTYELWEMLTIRQIAISRCLPQHRQMVVEMFGEEGVGAGRIGTLLSEPPADGVDDEDGAELDFAAGVDEAGAARPSGVDASGRPVLDLDVSELDDPDASELDGDPDGVDAYGSELPDDLDETHEAATPRPEVEPDEDAVATAWRDGVRADASIPPWVRPDEDEAAEIARMEREKEAMDDEVVPRDPRDESRTDGMDATDTMMVEIDRTLDVTRHYADVERERTPEERAELIRAAREVTFAQDMATSVPREVMAVLAPLAVARGMTGFTRSDAQSALEAQEITCNKTSVARWMRILTSQGHLERLRGVGPQGADIYRMGERHRATG